jgi:glycosyltransferase involved in cell wall biosynthesis
METVSPQLVSIIMPTYNGAQYIKRALQSVIDQSYQQWELIIIDDGSDDQTKTATAIANYLADNRVMYLKNEKNLGIQKTLNRGLAQAKGEYIARIDDDDIWADPEKLRQQVDFLETRPQYVLVGTGTSIVDEEGKELIRYLLPQDDTAIRNKILGKNCFVHSSVMFKKSAALKVGGYNESRAILHLEDYDLWLKLGTVGKLANLPLYAVIFTLRNEGLSSKNKLHQAIKALSLAHTYRKKYPHYLFSIIRSTARIIVYGIILQFPIKVFVNKLAKWYKEHW